MTGKITKAAAKTKTKTPCTNNDYLTDNSVWFIKDIGADLRYFYRGAKIGHRTKVIGHSGKGALILDKGIRE